MNSHRTGHVATLVLTIALSACGSQIPSLASWSGSLIGQDVQTLRDLAAAPQSYSSRIGWKEKTYPLPNGNWIYVQPDRPNCEIHFEVNTSNIIVGYEPVGPGCRHQ